MTPDPDSSLSSGAPEELRLAWEKVRLAFKSSIMVNTALSSLAQNLDGPDWPVAGPGETPAKYLNLSFDDLIAMPELAGHPRRVELLIEILKETQAFDDPFGEM